MEVNRNKKLSIEERSIATILLDAFCYTVPQISLVIGVSKGTIRKYLRNEKTYREKTKDLFISLYSANQFINALKE